MTNDDGRDGCRAPTVQSREMPEFRLSAGISTSIGAEGKPRQMRSASEAMANRLKSHLFEKKKNQWRAATYENRPYVFHSQHRNCIE